MNLVIALILIGISLLSFRKRNLYAGLSLLLLAAISFYVLGRL